MLGLLLDHLSVKNRDISVFVADECEQIGWCAWALFWGAFFRREFEWALFTHFPTQHHPTTSLKWYLHQQTIQKLYSGILSALGENLCLPLYLFCMFYAFKTTLIMKYAWAGWLCGVLGKIALKISTESFTQIFIFIFTKWNEKFYWFWTRSKRYSDIPLLSGSTFFAVLCFHVLVYCLRLFDSNFKHSFCENHLFVLAQFLFILPIFYSI